MIPIIIGISSGLLVISLIAFLNHLDKKVIYGLTLSGIGFLYVGFVWSDLQALVINSIQSIVFLFLSYYGIKRSVYFLTIGYFLHGCWDIAYGFINEPEMIPPHYDLFCLSIDFTICAYLAILYKQFRVRKSIM